jgi:hypothetical protein
MSRKVSSQVEVTCWSTSPLPSTRTGETLVIRQLAARQERDASEDHSLIRKALCEVSRQDEGSEER